MCELGERKRVKFYQAAMLLPNLLSWVVIGFIAYAFRMPIRVLLIIPSWPGWGWSGFLVFRTGCMASDSDYREPVEKHRLSVHYFYGQHFRH